MYSASDRMSLSGGGGYTCPIPTRGTFGRGASSSTTWVGVALAEAASRSRSLAAAAAASVRDVPVVPTAAGCD
jgi:hypothetical protein